MGRLQRAQIGLINISQADQAQLGLIAAKLNTEDARIGSRRRFKWPGVAACLARAGTLEELVARVAFGRDRAALPAVTNLRHVFIEPALHARLKAAAKAVGVLEKHLPRLLLAGIPAPDRERLAFEGYAALKAADEAEGVVGGTRRGRANRKPKAPRGRKAREGQTFLPAIPAADRARLAEIGEMLALADKTTGGVLQPDGSSIPFGYARTLFALLRGMTDTDLAEAVSRGKATPGAGAAPWSKAHTEPDLRARLRRVAALCQVEARSLPGLALAGTPRDRWAGLALAGMHQLQEAARVEAAAA